MHIKGASPPLLAREYRHSKAAMYSSAWVELHGRNKKKKKKGKTGDERRGTDERGKGQIVTKPDEQITSSKWNKMGKIKQHR
ncbi:hypothetical protein POVCU1_028340 [Plasmodium ovale curtisi]|uniref:Uncharacterized protein n=1 Tax=Plasmodium ovale curtisi TaxID=864141 RepID=A0A1A8WNI7_PLAOA|nr:hypothetical protein POVCU1_028340 [Plasmodium ovale curtisi]